MEKFYFNMVLPKLIITNNVLTWIPFSTQKEYQIADAYKKIKKTPNKSQKQTQKLSLKIINDNGKHCFPGYSAIILALPHVTTRILQSCFLPI